MRYHFKPLGDGTVWLARQGNMLVPSKVRISVFYARLCSMIHGPFSHIECGTRSWSGGYTAKAINYVTESTPPPCENNAIVKTTLGVFCNNVLLCPLQTPAPPC